jgi:hypothetical protein
LRHEREFQEEKNVSQFHITNDNTEDTYDSTDHLQDAIRIAREVVQSAQAGEPVCIQHKGKNIWQFVLMPNGKVAEEALADVAK